MLPILEELRQQKERFAALKPLSVEVIKSAQEEINLLFIHNSNALSNTIITITDTKSILDGYTIAGIPLQDHLEIMGHAKALQYILQLATTDNELAELHIKKIHALINGKAHPEVVNKHGFAAAQKIKAFLDWYHASKNHYHPVEFACRICSEFLKMNLFATNNDKIARLLMNLAVLRADYPLIIIDSLQKDHYQEALNNAIDHNAYTDFINFIGTQLLADFHRYFNLIANRKYVDNNYEHEFVL